MIKSAAFKLTLWYLAMIMVLSFLFSLALYRESSSQLTRNAARQQLAIDRLPLPPSLEPQRTALMQELADQLNLSLRQLLFRLGLLNLTTLMLGGAASNFLARRTLQPIQESLDAQGRFTADASHELRTPLTAMRTEIEVALREKHLSSAEARELLGSNLEEIAKLEALSASLLRLARFEGKLDPATLEKVLVRELFEEATGRFHLQIKARDIKLEVETGEQTVVGDRASLIEVVAVLLDNAIKYSPPGSTIKLRAQNSGSFVKLSVSDHGVGINAADIPNIFHRFYRADLSRSKDQIQGYGLGLSIAKRITDLHHGDISVASAPGEGSTFQVKLPIHYVQKNPYSKLSLRSWHIK